MVSLVFCMCTVACCRRIKTSMRRGEGYREEALDHTLDHTLIILWLFITELFKAVNYLWNCVLCFVYTEFVCIYTCMCVFYKIFMKGVGLKGGRGLPGKLTRRRG